MAKVIQIVGYKNSGKTTLVQALVTYFSNMQLRVGTVKHDGHGFEMDHPNTDTWLHRQAGAEIVAITSKNQTAMIEQKPSNLQAILDRMTGMDIILVEGFKQETFPKIVLVKNEDDKDLIVNIQEVIAYISWGPAIPKDKPTFSISDQLEICKFVQDYFSL